MKGVLFRSCRNCCKWDPLAPSSGSACAGLGMGKDWKKERESWTWFQFVCLKLNNFLGLESGWVCKIPWDPLPVCVPGVQG